MIEMFPEFAASTYAHMVDNTIILIAALTGFFFFLTLGIFFWLIAAGSARQRQGAGAEYLTGDETQPKKFITWTHYAVLVCDVFIVWAAVLVWVEIKQTLPENTPAQQVQEVRIWGQQWAWSFEHAGPDGKLDTPDDIRTVDSMYVEVNRPVVFQLMSRDVVHDFSVPAFRLKQDAIPGRIIHGWFEATREGSYEVQCAEMCGIGHALMPGFVHVQSPAAHREWMGLPPAAETALATVATAATETAPATAQANVQQPSVIPAKRASAARALQAGIHSFEGRARAQPSAPPARHTLARNQHVSR